MDITINDEKYEAQVKFDHAIKTENGLEYYVFESQEQAGKEARDYWENMAQNDPEKLICIVGEKALLAWALNQPYAVGAVNVRSLQEWLDLSLDCPAEHFATHDNEECEVSACSSDLVDALGFVPTVAYRM